MNQIIHKLEKQGVEYVVDPETQQGVQLTNGVSVFTTELLAIIWAFWWAEQAKPKKTVFCSASVAALLALRNGTSRSRNDFVNETLPIQS